MINRADQMRQLCEEGLGITRNAYQVLITPGSGGVTIRFNDDTLGNPDLRFQPIHMSHEDFAKVIEPNAMTMATHQNATDLGHTYGIFVSQRIISRLARWGDPETRDTQFQHRLNKRFPTDIDVERTRMMSGRV